MTTLLMLRGLPASGKSTFAQGLVAQGYVRVNKDEFRAMLHGGAWSKAHEKQVLRLRDLVIADALSHGQNVVVDDTNFAAVHEQRLRELAAQHGAEFAIDDQFLAVPLEECIARDLKRLNSVGEQVIRKMYRQYIATPVEPYPFDMALPLVVLCDIDGTLALMRSGRSPYDWKRVGEDELDVVVSCNLNYLPHKVILLSGRDAVCRAETEQWLALHGVQYEALLMRPVGDMRKDAIVKRELFDQHIRGKYNVLCIFDYRNQVVEMWRAMGLKVLQVAEGDF